jgi:DNA-binding IclR family transcriptional regulator
MLKALVRERLVARNADKRFVLGMLTFELGLAATQRMALIDELRPVLRNVAGLTGDTVYMVARGGDEAVCMAREEGHFPIRTLILEVGGRRPLGLGAGSLHLLSQYPDDEVDAVIRRNEAHYGRFHNMDAQVLRESVQDARKAGYGLIHSRLTQGVSGVGIALPNFGGRPYAAISIACISSRLDDAHCEHAVSVMRSAVDAWHKTSGHVCAVEI